MENQTEDEYTFDLDITGRKLVAIFFVILVVCGCFFVAGYVIRGGVNPIPENYVDAGIGRNSETGRRSNDEAYSPAKKPVDEPVLPPPALVEQTPAPVETAVPVAAADKPKPRSEEMTSNVAVQTSVEKTAPPAKQAASGKILYAVQVAAFRNIGQVEEKEVELKAKGFESWIEYPQTPGDYYRVRVGRFETRAEAGRMQTRLKENGFDTMIAEVK